MEKKTKNDEIDLLNTFLQGINIIRANFWLVASFFLLGIVFGAINYYTSRKVFENKMVVSSAILTRSYGKILIENVNSHLRENNVKSISTKLNISENIVKDIGQIRIENFIAADELKESDRFIITAEVFSQEILPELQKGLIHYLENNEYVKVRVEQDKSYLKQMISKIDQEIKDMEEFKVRIFKGDFFQSIKGNVMFDPTTVNSKILELTKEKIKLQNSFAIANSVQVIEGFTKFDNPTGPKLSVSLLTGSITGLLFVGIFLAFKSIRKLLKMADVAKQSA